MVHDPAFKVYEQHLKSIHVSQDLPRSFHPAESSHTLHELQSHWLPITLSFLESLDSSQSVPFLSLKEPDSKWSTIIHEGVAILREQQTLASNVALLRDDIGLGERAIRTDTRPAVYRIHRDKEWGSLFKKLLPVQKAAIHCKQTRRAATQAQATIFINDLVRGAFDDPHRSGNIMQRLPADVGPRNSCTYSMGSLQAGYAGSEFHEESQS